MRPPRTSERVEAMSDKTHPALTAHERRVAALVARGLTNAEIGLELTLSPKTVEAHLSSIYRKLELRSRTELALHIVRCGFPPDAERALVRNEPSRG
jgi:DNA-binding NarL/FixJ family response regulator